MFLINLLFFEATDHKNTENTGNNDERQHYSKILHKKSFIITPLDNENEYNDTKYECKIRNKVYRQNDGKIKQFYHIPDSSNPSNKEKKFDINEHNDMKKSNILFYIPSNNENSYTTAEKNSHNNIRTNNISLFRRAYIWFDRIVMHRQLNKLILQCCEDDLEFFLRSTEIAKLNVKTISINTNANDSIVEKISKLTQVYSFLASALIKDFYSDKKVAYFIINHQKIHRLCNEFSETFSLITGCFFLRAQTDEADISSYIKLLQRELDCFPYLLPLMPASKQEQEMVFKF